MGRILLSLRVLGYGSAGFDVDANDEDGKDIQMPVESGEIFTMLGAAKKPQRDSRVRVQTTERPRPLQFFGNIQRCCVRVGFLKKV